MYTRVVKLQVEPAQGDEGIKAWTEGVLPVLKRQPGFLGVTLVGDRETGRGLVVSYWETERAMAEAREQVRPEAIKVMSATGGTIGADDTYEVAVMERLQPAKAGVFVRLTTVHGKPELAAEGIADFGDKVLPVLRTQP